MIGLLRKLMDQLCRITKENKLLSIAYPLVEATDSFFFSKSDVTAGPPHVREHMNLKRLMSMVMVCLAPCALWGIYHFGWRVLALIIVSYAFGVGAEAIFCGLKKEEINEGAFVTCLLYPLILPPNTPFWIAAVGIVFGIIFGKEVFGGTGHNIFNPALVGRCFVYISFPKALTGNVWSEPIVTGATGGFTRWAQGVDGLTSATPATAFKSTEALPAGTDWDAVQDLLFGLTSGCPGETFRIWIIMAGILLAAWRVASFSIMLSTVLGAFLTASIGHALAPAVWPTGLMGVLSGGLLFGAVFMATDPVTSPRHWLTRWIHGLGIGAISIVIWICSGYPQGVMFAILLMNTFSPIIDHFAIRHRYLTRRAAA